jgi:hypothetical protein
MDVRKPATLMRIAGSCVRHDPVPALASDGPFHVLHLTCGWNCSGCYAENELPQPQPPVEFGFLNVKPEPCIDET